MPEGGAPARGRQSAWISQLAQEKIADPEIGRLLDQLEPYARSLPDDNDDAAIIRATRREYDQLMKVPPDLIGAVYSHAAHSYQVWIKARPDNDFTAVRPELEKTLDLSRQLADCFPGYEHIADPLIDFADYGMKASDVRRVFGELREQLVPIVRAISAQEPADDAPLRNKFAKEKQLAFSEFLSREIGYDFKRGRLDLTHHPFMTKFSLGDVRITTRVDEEDLGNCLFSVLHESGHAMYEQGICQDYEGTVLAWGLRQACMKANRAPGRISSGAAGRFGSTIIPSSKRPFPNSSVMKTWIDFTGRSTVSSAR